MTREELRQHDGRSERKALVAVNGKIYDVTGSPLWRDGDHQGVHQAGADLTEELKDAPHVRAVIERFEVVDRLASPPPQTSGNSGKLWLAILLVAVLAVVLVLLIRS